MYDGTTWSSMLDVMHLPYFHLHCLDFMVTLILGGPQSAAVLLATGTCSPIHPRRALWTSSLSERQRDDTETCIVSKLTLL